MHNLNNLKLWQKAISIAENIYVLSTNFPVEEKFGLTSQIKRSAVSMPSNIAEGAGRNTKVEFKKFLGIANACSYDLYTQLVLAHKINLVEKIQLNPFWLMLLKFKNKLRINKIFSYLSILNTQY